MSAYTPLGPTGLLLPVGYMAEIMAIDTPLPTLYYPLDDVGTGSARELMRGLKGTVIGPASGGASGPGTGNAFQFSNTPNFASSGYVLTPTNIAVGIFNNQGPWSIEHWFKQTAAQNATQFTTGMWVWAPQANLPPLQQPPAATFQPAGYLNWSGLGPAGAVNGYGGNATTSLVTSAAGFADGNWHQYVFTYDGGGAAGNLVLYADGAQVANAATVGVNTAETPGGFQIGISGNNNRGGTFNGNLAHFTVWNRVLTLAEVTAHFNAMGTH